VSTTTARGLPAWARGGDIGDVDGDLEKHDCQTEETPYAAMILRDLQASRGSAYTKLTGTFVHVENLALARFLSAVFYRKPEKFRCNMLPGTSAERLPYWQQLLGVPSQLDEPARVTRQKLAVHYRGSVGATIQVLREELSRLLGEAYVDVYAAKGTDLESPPTDTYWPVINPGSADMDIGGGGWFSGRSTIIVEYTQPVGMPDGELDRLLNVDMYALLDRLLPGWANWLATEV
jgi:hypothetical protein